jgi:hypothetical protein
LLKVGPAAADQLAKTPAGRLTLLALSFTPRTATCFGRVEPYQSNVWATVVQADRVAVDDVNRNRGRSRDRWFGCGRNSPFTGEVRRNRDDSEADESAKGDHAGKIENTTLFRLDADNGHWTAPSLVA